AEVIEIGFERGIPISINGEKMDGLSLIQKLNKIGGKHGVGRSDIIEDRVLGLKMRESYEHPAATILLKAHRDLEKLVLTRAELKFKAMVDDMWGELAYQGLVDDPLMADLNAFIDKTQERVTGFVKARLFKGNARVVARRSPNALIFEGSLNQKSAEGYSKFYGLQARIFQKLIKRF
ncbi:argininosuccinate synthase, partial [Halobacteriota archaeon]